MQNRQVIHTADFVKEAVEWIEDSIGEALERGRAVVSLCGGGTPRPIYEALARKSLPWDRIIWTFGDERCVPPDHAESNYRMAKIALFDPAGVLPENVIRIKGELPPTEAAQECESRLREIAGTDDEILRHDLVLLGLGGDGHTASLFPGSTALEETKRWVVENHVAKFESWRVTFTYPLINAAREIVFLVGDESKRGVVEEVLSRQGDHPAEGIQPQADGNVNWLLGY
jgi:6-phosphogluconolactonase